MKSHRPEDILELVSRSSSLSVNMFDDIFPSPDEIDNMLEGIPPDPIDPSLAVMDPLVPPSSAFKSKEPPSQAFDDRGYSAYARIVSAVLLVFTDDRQSAKEHMWTLRHFLALALYAEDLQQMPSASSPVFGRNALPVDLTDIISRVKQITTYLLTSSPDDGWLLSVVTALVDDKPADDFRGLSRFLIDLIRHAESVDTIRESRILRNVLQHILDVDKVQADLWILFARKVENTGPWFCLKMIKNEASPLG